MHCCYCRRSILIVVHRCCRSHSCPVVLLFQYAIVTVGQSGPKEHGPEQQQNKKKRKRRRISSDAWAQKSFRVISSSFATISYLLFGMAKIKCPRNNGRGTGPRSLHLFIGNNKMSDRPAPLLCLTAPWHEFGMAGHGMANGTADHGHDGQGEKWLEIKLHCERRGDATMRG